MLPAHIAQNILGTLFGGRCKLFNLILLQICDVFCMGSSAKALLVATPKSQFRESGKKKKLEGLSPEEIARMEKETEGLANDIKIVKEAHGKDMLNLVLACGYLSRMLENNKVTGFLSSHYPDIFSEFQKIIEATSLST